jgi:hypothetical protein
MKYFADLGKLSIELQEKSSNLEEYLYGVDVGRLVRWNEIVFLLEFCHDALSTSPSDADNSVLSRKSTPDTQRIKEIETLIGSLLVDELFLDKPDAFGSIYALRPPAQGVKPSSSSFRIHTFQELSLLLGRKSTKVEYLNSSAESWKNGEMNDISPQRSRKFLALSSCFYLMYMALGEFADLKHTIQIFRQQKLPGWTSLDSSDIPPTEDGTRRVSLPRPMSEDTSSI